MEEPGTLEVSTKSVSGMPRDGNAFIGNALEFEYGVKTWWTSELYLDGQTTFGESTVFTGWRLENRFRPLLKEHWINPVLYFEFEDINSADKTLLEVVGHDGIADFLERNDSREKEREAEPWEFGYAIGASRPLSMAASANPCTFCRENFTAGAEMYGGLGDRYSFGLKDTSHYIAPTVAWRMPQGTTVSLSPGFGLNSNS